MAKTRVVVAGALALGVASLALFSMFDQRSAVVAPVVQVVPEALTVSAGGRAPSCPQAACELESQNRIREAFEEYYLKDPHTYLETTSVIGEGVGGHRAVLMKTCCGAQVVAKSDKFGKHTEVDTARGICEHYKRLEPVWKATDGAVPTYFGFWANETTHECYQSFVTGFPWRIMNDAMLAGAFTDDAAHLAGAKKLVASGFDLVRRLREADVVQADLNFENVRFFGDWNDLKIHFLDFNGAHVDWSVEYCDKVMEDLAANWATSQEVKDKALEEMRSVHFQVPDEDGLVLWQGPCFSDRDEIAITMMSAFCPQGTKSGLPNGHINRNGGCSVPFIMGAKPGSLLAVLRDVAHPDFPNRLRDFDKIFARIEAATSLI